MLPTNAYAIASPDSQFAPFQCQRRAVGPHDVLIKILYCGVCHSDIHNARNEWGYSTYPMIPGHEIVGRVVQVGSLVKKFKMDDVAGVGCFLDSCRQCSSCKEGSEHHCEKEASWTYNGVEQNSEIPTYGGYSSQIVVDENYVLKVSPNLPLANIAPLLCAGITTYSALRQHNAGPGKRIAVAGLGGLGHMAVKFAVAMGAEVTVLSTSPAKRADALSLGAQHFVVTTDADNLPALARRFDLLIDAISAAHNPHLYLDMLRPHGVMILIGAPEKPLELQALPFIFPPKILASSFIGGISETQEMLDFCAEKGITSDVEIITLDKIEEAFDRTLKGDVRYRFVLDLTNF